MATVITFRLTEDQKNLRSPKWGAVIACTGDGGWIDRGISFANESDTAAKLLSREAIVYAYMRSLRKRIRQGV
jgi:hypothetical protein